MDFSETKCELFQPDEKTKLLARIWLPEKKVKAVFLAIHGGLAHGGDWVTPAQYFQKHGIATYALDLRWHGTYPLYNKGGKLMFHIGSYDEYTSDIHAFYLRIRNEYPKTPIFILSHSNGSLIALKYGLDYAGKTDIKGVVVSSPWLKNKVKMPAIVVKMVGFLARIAPTMTVTPEDFTDRLTHDPAITARHHADTRSGLRGTKATVKLGLESMKTQKWLLENLRRWEGFPLFAVIAGQDVLADAEASINALGTIDPALLTMTVYEENYHENFNELNREETFKKILKWIRSLGVKLK